MPLKSRLLINLIALALGLAACAPANTPTPAPTATNTSAPTFTPTAPPTSTQTSTPEPTATEAPLPTETPVPDGLISQTLAEKANVILFLPEMEMLAVGKRDGTVELLSVKTGSVLQSFTAHTGGVQALAFHFESGLLATGSRDQTIKLWHIFDGYDAPEEVATLTSHTNTVQGLAFAQDGNALVSASADGTARVWSLGTQSTLFTLEAPGSAVWSVAAYANTIATGHGDNAIRLWDASTGQLQATLEGHGGPVWSVAFRPSRYQLASASSDGTIKIWDVGSAPDLQKTLNGHGNTVWSVAYSPDGRTLVSGGEDASVRVWNMDDYAPLTSFENEGQSALSVTFHSLPYWLAIEPDAPDTLIFSSLSADGALKTWALNNRPIPTPQPVAAASKTPAATAQPIATTDSTAIKLSANSQLFANEITDAYWSHDGLQLIVTTIDSILIYNSQNLKQLVSIPRQGGLTYLNPDGTLGIDNEDTRTTWNTKTGTQINSIPLVSLKQLDETFANNAPLIYHNSLLKLTVLVGYPKLGGETAVATVVNRETGQIIFNIGLGSGRVAFVDGNPLGKFVGVGSVGNVIEEVDVINLETGELQLSTTNGYGSSDFAISSDNHYLVAVNSEPDHLLSSPNFLKIHDLQNESATHRYLQHPYGYNFIDNLLANGFSPDNRWLGTIRDREGFIWDFASGQPKFELVGIGGQETVLRFSPDNRRVLVANGSSVQIWNLP